MAKNEVTLTIKRFMVDDLKLSGNELIIYALIYSYSKDGGGELFATKTYISELIGLSIASVYRVIAELLRREVILEAEQKRAVRKTKSYIVNPYMVSLLDTYNEEAAPAKTAPAEKFDPIEYAKELVASRSSSNRQGAVIP